MQKKKRLFDGSISCRHPHRQPFLSFQDLYLLRDFQSLLLRKELIGQAENNRAEQK